MRSLKILFLTNAHNSMSQRALLELQKNKHNVHVRIVNDGQGMLQAKDSLKPDLIICPQLTTRVPKEVWSDRNTPCLIMHPGVQGDRGISSLDWALKTEKKKWGVTLLQAEEEMDTGDIWSSKVFPINRSDPSTLTKSSLYMQECVSASMHCIHEAVRKFIEGIRPKKLNYNDPETIGNLRPAMKQADRAISWNMGVDEIAHNIRYSDTQPGVKVDLWGEEIFVYSPFPEKMKNSEMPPGLLGSVLYKRHGAVAVKAKDGILWLRTLKRKGGIKLPATSLLPTYVKLHEYPEQSTELTSFHTPFERPKTFQDIWTCTNSQGVCYLHFDFPNGACSTDQLMRLGLALKKIRHNPNIKLLLLMGGYNAFSCGIHLNVIQHSLDPVRESLRNINAMNDVIRELFQMTNKLTVSVLQGTAGAGGVMQAIAADLVWTHEQNILNPHYKLMGLSGSEYWTHFLPERVGNEMSQKLTEFLEPITAFYAKEINLIDDIIAKDVEGMRACLEEKVNRLTEDAGYIEMLIRNKRNERDEEWFSKVERKRKIEISKMLENFKTQEYNTARSKFVRKIKPISTPPSLLKEGSVRMKGLPIKNSILEELQVQVDSMRSRGYSPPLLKILMVPGSEASLQYVKKKKEACKKVGIRSEVITFSQQSANLEEALLNKIHHLNQDTEVDGIMTQLPLPPYVDVNKIMAAIDPEKDADGMTPTNLGLLARNDQSGIVPCTPNAILQLLLEHGVQISGKHVTVVGKSPALGIPAALNFLNECATVTVCHLHTPCLKTHISLADIVIAAAGSPDCIDQDWIKDGAVVVNVGMTKINGSFVGDVTIDPMHTKAKLYTTPTGGVGPLTVAMLLKNVVDIRSRKIRATRICSSEVIQNL